MNKQTSEMSAIAERSQQVVDLINGELDAPLEDVFTPEFLAAVPPAQLQAISGQLTGQFGRAVAIEKLEPADGVRSALEVRMERAIAKGGIAIDTSQGNRISELLFQTFDPIDDSVEKISADLEALPGEVSAYFGPLDGNTPTISVNPDEQFAIGSTFKLYVLAALGAEIKEGKRSWDDVVPLTVKSYPSGMMQDWPEGAPVTLQTLASMMISISDNTATDQLISEIGRETVFETLEATGHSDPRLNEPFLTTREMFLLKSGDPSWITAYSNGDADARAAILKELRRAEVSVEKIRQAFSGGPVAIDIEWFANASDLAALFEFMRANCDPGVFDIMAINPSMSSDTKAQWSYAGYKGGSEPGVLNLTWLLTDAAGEDHLLALSWNNPEATLDQTAFELIAQRILSLPR
ncbi:serine hydrolase [Erythrobacter sp. THAF29]|uniref:serine hydrolase n=1 Tax=Erythrobacter sp. THAF29 TaxID=2587851 RepID=UPI001561BA9C|nr:serine hydrolase [Erythrobacter sp. THAF29]